MSFYTYEFELSSEMKVHSMFHISLLWFSKDNLIDIASYNFMTSLKNAFQDSHYLIILIWSFLTVIKIQTENFIKILKLLTNIVSLQYFCYIKNFKIFIFCMHVVSLCSCLWLWFLIMIKIEFLFMIFLLSWFISWFMC